MAIGPMSADQNPSAYRVSAYRTRRDYLLGYPDYSQTVVDEPGRPPAAERADVLWGELLIRSTYKRFGWRVITRTPLTDLAEKSSAALAGDHAAAEADD